MSELRLEWGIKGLKKALKRRDNIVIIDQLRFSSAVVTATSLQFTIEPTSDNLRRTEGFSLSPSTFLNKKPSRVVVESPNGAYLSLNARKAKCVIYGSILNAKAIANWIDKIGENTTLIAAGEVGPERLQFITGNELVLSKRNKIFAMEDALAAGAIAHFVKMNKSKECIGVQELFENTKNKLLETLRDTASHRYLESRSRGDDTVLCSKLNLYKVVPKLFFVRGIPEIRAR
ncbi:MAG: 2-phosphosulfolactate phosphatase [Candidatus Micrarchaeota archaeon]|nr:2-phosphosulfolactate phosphatase [Candidatus Micrarchaeota archaeon]